MGKLLIRQPATPGQPRTRLTMNNFRNGYCMRWNSDLGFIRISITTLRYFDRGAGSFMGGGAWITEAHVNCSVFPLDVIDKPPLPTSSIAGWVIPQPEKTTPAPNLTSVKTKIALDKFNRKFWSLSEAIEYANGATESELAQQTCLVSVRKVKGEVRIKVEP